MTETPEFKRLLPFQQEDVRRLSIRDNVQFNHDMGTGKTWMALGLDSIRREQCPERTKTLIIAPLSTLDSPWSEVIDDLNPVRLWRRVDPKDRSTFLDVEADYYLIHWEALRLLPELAKVKWLHVIADESHRAKNRKAQQTRALKRLRPKFRTALSGTPVTTRPDNYWSILNWLYPTKYSSYWRFYNQFVDFEVVYPQGYHKLKGPKNEDQLLMDLEPFTARRTKEEVLPDLPAKYYSRRWVELDPQQRRAYDAMKKEMLAWVGEHGDEPVPAPIVIAQLIRLQQFASAYAAVEDGHMVLTEPSSKLDAVMDIIEDHPDQKLVVFSNFKQMIRLLEKRLDKEKIEYVTITGDTDQADRGNLIRAFQNGTPRVFLGTIQAGGVGITLTASSTVIFLDRNWSPALNVQAEDRLHRKGQQEAVQVIDVMAKGTVDLGRAQQLEMKWSWIKRLLGDER